MLFHKASANISRLAVPEKIFAPLSLDFFDRCGNCVVPSSATGSGTAQFPTSHARRNNPRSWSTDSSPQPKRKGTLMGAFVLVAEVGFEPHDLRVMSPTSYQAALLRDIDFFALPPFGAGDRGRTGTILSYHGILSPGRLPVPPHRHAPRVLRSIGSHHVL